MATYSEVTSNTATYDEDLGLDWDGGLTVWDVIGNTATTYWEVPASQSYIATQDTTKLYLNQSISIWDSGSTYWDVVGNLPLTQWDIPSQTYTSSTGNTTTWTEA